jgi:hypothetical protein
VKFVFCVPCEGSVRNAFSPGINNRHNVMLWQLYYYYFYYYYILIIGNLKEREHFEDLDVDGMIILKWT